MSVVHKETSLLERILTECEEDHVGLWSIVRQVREANYLDPRVVTLGLLHFLLSTGIVEAGLPDAHGGFQTWHSSADDSVKRIAEEWLKLGRDPDIGDIVWFTTSRAAHS